MSSNTRNMIDELLVYEADDERSAKEANDYLESNRFTDGKTAIVGARGLSSLELVINNFSNIRQLTICMPGIFENFRKLRPVQNLFETSCRLMFLDVDSEADWISDECSDRARDQLIIDNGRHFFANKEGIVGISVTSRYKGQSAMRRLTMFQLKAGGEVVMRKTVRPAGLKCG